MNPSEYDKAWAAGIFDGDGYVLIYDDRVQLGITNVFIPVLVLLKGMYGGSISGDRRREKPDWTWTLYANNAERFLRGIYPYTNIKRDQVGLILDFIDGNNNMSWDELKLELQRVKRIEYTDIDGSKDETFEIIERMRNLDLLYPYLAGLVDTDGSININMVKRESNRTDPILNLSISNSHLPTMKAISIILGSGDLRGADTPGRKTWNYRLVSRQAESVLKKILPHLNIKRERAHRAIEFQSLKQPGRNQYTPQEEKDLAFSKQARLQRQMKALQNIRFPDESRAITYLEKVPVY